MPDRPIERIQDENRFAVHPLQGMSATMLVL
jgi:hypothetical protein